jgi:hypothetical protein
VTKRWPQLAGLVALQLLSCGGNLPACQNGDCTLPGRTTIKWTFDAYPELLFPDDSCLDMGAVNVHLDLVGIDDPTVVESSNDPTAMPPTMDPQCSDGQYIFLSLPPGNYAIAITPLDGDGNPIVSAPIMGMVMGGQSGADTELTVNVPYTAWTHTYTGTFLFNLQWGGQSCATAVPPVAKQTLTLLANGVAVTAVTDSGQRLDGTDPEPCRDDAFAQFVENLPFGPATFTAVGTDATDTVQFSHTFDTFIGATKNNPTITFDVPPPDAAVDAAADTAMD